MWTALWLLALQMTVSLEPTARPKVTAQEVARGRALFEAQCAYCHGTGGDGGRGANLARPALRHAPTDEALFRVVNRGIPGGGAFGPDLTDAGARSSPAFLRESLLDPNADVPSGFMQVRAVTREGQRLTGVRVNEDPFSIQFRDATGALYSFFKNELAEFAKDEGKTPMPSYRDRLTLTALDDLVAYLVSLEGSR